MKEITETYGYTETATDTGAVIGPAYGYTEIDTPTGSLIGAVPLVFEEKELQDAYEKVMLSIRAVGAYRSSGGSNAAMEHQIMCNPDSYIRWHNHFAAKEDV